MAIDMDAIIAAVQAAQLLKDKDLKAAPQSFDPLLGKFVPLLSDNGAARHVLYDANGNPLSIVDNKLAVRAAEAETAISALAAALKGANDKTLSDIATTLSSQSTAEKQEALANLVGALDAEVVSDPAAAGAVIALLKGLLSRLQTLENKIDSFTTGEETVNTELKGSLVETYKAVNNVVSNFTVAAGALATIYTYDSNTDPVDMISVLVKTPSTEIHDYSVYYQGYIGGYTSTAFSKLLGSSNNRYIAYTEEPFKVMSPHKFRIHVKNNDTIDHTYEYLHINYFYRRF